MFDTLREAFGGTRRVQQLEDVVRRQQLVIADLAGRLGIDPATVDPFALDAHEQQLVADGRPVQAMKQFRERTGAGLLQAKQAVDTTSH